MSEFERGRLAWWLLIAILAVGLAYIAHAFIGIISLGLFGYYAIRPISDRLQRYVDSERVAATLTVSTVLLPILLLLLYASSRILQQVRERIGENVGQELLSRLLSMRSVPADSAESPAAILQNPPSLQEISKLTLSSGLEQALQAVNAVFGTLLLLALSVALAYALLEYDERISDTFATLAGGEDTTVYTYAMTIDEDLQSIFFGNLLFALVMAVIATATYTATNLVAPGDIHVPMVLTLGFLTGVCSLIPVVVGKVVYLPIVGYLALQVSGSSRIGYLFIGGVLVVYLLVLDLLPQSFIQPYLSGRHINPFILLFAYVLGPMLVGWYGFFLMPIIFIVALETVRIVLPELVHGEPILPDASVAENTGTDPEAVHDEATDDGAPDSDGPQAGDSTSGGSGSGPSGSPGDGTGTPQG